MEELIDIRNYGVYGKLVDKILRDELNLNPNRQRSVCFSKDNDIFTAKIELNKNLIEKFLYHKIECVLKIFKIYLSWNYHSYENCSYSIFDENYTICLNFKSISKNEEKNIRPNLIELLTKVKKLKTCVENLENKI